MATVSPSITTVRPVRRRLAGAFRRSGLALILGLFPLFARPAEAATPEEFQVKAIFLYNFVQFVDWPPGSFATPESPIVIGVLGQDPFGGFLDELVRGERVKGRPLVVERYRWPGEIDECHVLFISGSEGSRIEQIAAALRGRPILTVGDWESFARHGGMIHFVLENKRVRLRINLDAARAVGLTISSKLLRSAESVTQQKEP